VLSELATFSFSLRSLSLVISLNLSLSFSLIELGTLKELKRELEFLRVTDSVVSGHCLFSEVVRISDLKLA